MSYNFLDKTGLTYFWSKIKAKIPTKTSQLTNDSYFNYSSEVTGGTIDALAAFTSGKPGLTGSISLAKKSSGVGSEIPAGWYNYYFAPHRSGVGGDNGQYGTIILTPMNFAGKSFILQRSNSTNTITSCKEIITRDQISNYVQNSNFYINTHPENQPVLIPFIHNDIAFLTQRGGSCKIYYDGVEKTVSSMNNMFDGSPSYMSGIKPTTAGITEIVIELTLHKVFAWTNTIYCDFGASGWRAKSVKIEVMNTNYAEDVWTVKGNATGNSYGNVKTTFTHTPVGATNAGGGFNKIRFTFSNFNSDDFRISQLGVYNYGSSGARETSMSRGIDDYVFRNITPNNNNTFNLGDSSHKWANVYASTFQGNATSATKATGDKNGADITTTYYKASNPNGYTSNTGTITGIKMNGATMGTSGMVDLGSIYNVTGIPSDADLNNYKSIGAYYSNTYVQNAPQLATQGFYLLVCKATDNYILQEVTTTSMVKYIRRWNGTVWTNWQEMKYTDTTYSSKTAASGGTDVSLVTTGEKYTWNNKTSNTGTVTSVSVKMNGATKGTVTASGTIDLGTVITAHQDISGKQDKLTAGTNIQIANNTISATDTKYTAGTGISISGNNVISATSSGGVTFDDVYPVGSIYMSVNNTDPSTLFGGTWEQLKDRFLLGAGDTYTAGDTGGEATHQLTKAELPAYDLYNASHSHTITSTAGYNGKQGNNPAINGGNNQGSGNYTSGGATIKVSSGGSNTPHNNMPPYLVVYMWKRTA